MELFEFLISVLKRTLDFMNSKGCKVGYGRLRVGRRVFEVGVGVVVEEVGVG